MSWQDEIITEIDNISREESGKLYWNGHETFSKNQMAAVFAKCFIVLLPDSIKAPEVDIDSGDSVDFSWDYDRYRVFSVSIDHEGTMHWAGLSRKEKDYGKELWNWKIPSIILDWIKKVGG